VSFQDNIPGVFARVFTQLWPTGTYTPLAGDAVSCSIRLIQEIESQPGFEVNYGQSGTEIEALVSEVSEPGIGSTFVLNSTTYTVKQVISNDGYRVRMAVR